MRISATTAIRRAAGLAALSALLLTPSAALAATGPVWRIGSISNTTVARHGDLRLTTVADGSPAPATDEIQRLRVDATSGQFRLSFGGQVTADLSYDASAAQLQAALEALSSIGAGNVAVSGGPGPVPFVSSRPYVYAIAFHGTLAAQDLPPLDPEPGTVPLGAQHTFYLELANVGDAPTDGSKVTLTVTLPPGMTGLSAEASAGLTCPTVGGATGAFTCTGNSTVGNRGGPPLMSITAAVTPDAPPLLTASFDLKGGGASTAAHTVDPVTVAEAPPGFGFDAFDVTLIKQGTASTRAADHPDEQVTAIDFATGTDPYLVVGEMWPPEDVRDVTVSLPPGLIGIPSVLGQCSIADLAEGSFTPSPLCLPETQVGVAAVRIAGAALGPTPIYNLFPPPGVPARFGFNVAGNIVTLDAHLRSGGDYGIDVTAANVPQALALTGNTATFWGSPFDPAHTEERNCAGLTYRYLGGAENCPASAPPAAFLRNPTSCSAPGQAAVSARLDSWQHPDLPQEQSVPLHAGPGYPYAPSDRGAPTGFDGCDQVTFDPSFSARPTTAAADSPTGLDIELAMPQQGLADPDALSESDLRAATVTLPAGLTVNPSSATGRESCSPAQVGLATPIGSTPIHFDTSPVKCPDAAKIGAVELQSPLLAEHDSQGKTVTDLAGNPVLETLPGSLYLAAQGQNPFGSLLSMYLVVEDPVSGTVIKLPGRIDADPATGRLTTSFTDTPQLPFSNLHVSLFGGPRAALRTPAACGTYTTNASLTPWSGNGAVDRQSSFQITQGCGGGFDPQLRSGIENPLAGATSPFNLRLSRADATQELAGLSVKLPPGLSGYLAGIPYCPDSTLAAISSELGTGVGETNAPSCPAASQIGRLTAGAGAGPTPFYTSTGRAYLAGPYKGAPLSIAVVAPAVAGPFDLGTVVVRNAIDLDQATAQLSVRSDPLPTIIHGIPLDLRDVRVEVNRDHFTLNPTSCEAKSVDATITSSTGATASRSNHFQVSGCERLGFKPKLSLRLKGKVNRTAHPSLSATYKARPGDANLARAQVKLPPAAFLDNAHIGAVCTRPQFAAHSCPAASVYGTASATTPILDHPLSGNVYLRSSDHKLPDLVADLRGPETQPIEVALAGKTDSVKGALRNTFELVPDAPVTKFNLRLFGGKRGLIEMSSGFCSRPRASVKLDGQNGRAQDTTPEVKSDCAGNPRKAHKHRRAHR